MFFISIFYILPSLYDINIFEFNEVKFIDSIKHEFSSFIVIAPLNLMDDYFLIIKEATF